MGACDALTFTPDGQHLLAAGDDKVVRVWRITSKGLESDEVKTLRWSSCAQQRGAIYALALSPDKESRQVAIAGYGMRTGTVAVLDRATGQTKQVLTDPKGNDRVIWSLAFSPNGKQLAFGTGDGSVWLWNLAAREANDSKRLGQHAGEPGGVSPRIVVNRIRLVAFLDDSRLISASEDGRVLTWEAGRPEGARRGFLRFDSVPLFRVALSPDRQWLAAAGEKSLVQVRSLDEKKSKDIELPAGNFPHSLAFDASGTRLAVGIRAVEQGANFFKETDDSIRVYDLTQQPAKQVFEAKASFHIEALAFHPDGKRLASAGGNDHEVILWDLDSGKKFNELRGPGSSLWGVALSRNGRYLSFRDQRDNNPASPNERAAGPWHVFDLEKRKWAQGGEIDRLEPLKSAGGWTVEFSQKDNRDAYTWYVAGPNGERYILPLDRDRDAMPRCYTFLPAAAGKPVRLAVGHYWGLSIFDLTERGPRRARLCTGHQGEVMSLGLSADMKWLVSASRDETVAAWSLADWPSQPELGAKFGQKPGFSEKPGFSTLIVDNVDVGSPAWEAGLIKGDEVVYFAFDKNEFLYDPQGKVPDARRAELKVKKVGTIAECLDRLQQPVPGKEFYFRIKRGQREIDLLTTVRQRPLWRFFPTHDRQWVLWMWRSYYYDTSTNGDFLIGWHVNNRDLDKEPAFYRAEQFRKYFHRPEVIDKLLGTRDVEAALRVATNNPVPPAFDDMEPPAVQIELASTPPSSPLGQGG